MPGAEVRHTSSNNKLIQKAAEMDLLTVVELFLTQSRLCVLSGGALKPARDGRVKTSR